MTKSDEELIVEKVEKIVTPVINDMGLSLVDVEYIQDGGYWYVRIYVENLNGEISLEDCATISGKIDEDIDKLIDKKFFLEVSSPGIERPLKKLEDFVRFSGEQVRVVLKHKIDENRNFVGKLLKITDNIIFLEVSSDKILEIPFQEIKKSNIVYEFDEF